MRYVSAAELAADLRRFLAGEPTVARPLTSAQRMLNWTRRRPALASLLAVSTVGALAFAAMSIIYFLIILFLSWLFYTVMMRKEES